MEQIGRKNFEKIKTNEWGAKTTFLRVDCGPAGQPLPE
jgi:hypothetical protein